MSDILVAPLVHPLADFRASFQDRRLDVVRCRQAEFVKQVEVSPDAHPIAIVSPGKVALRLRHPRGRAVAAEPGAKREILDVVANGKRQARTIRPFIGRPPMNRAEVVAIVAGEFHPSKPASSRARRESTVKSNDASPRAIVVRKRSRNTEAYGNGTDRASPAARNSLLSLCPSVTFAPGGSNFSSTISEP